MPEASRLTASIIIPTLNPQERIFAPVLSAVGRILERTTDRECVIVDNRSSPPVADMAYVRSFVSSHPCVRVVREERQGLTYAKLAGLRATSGALVIVFDDDNVPSATYVDIARSCVERYPWVGVWGPGRIDVELLDPVPSFMASRIRELFSQRSVPYVQYGCVPAAFPEFYPIGMGQVMRREVAESYRAAVERGDLGSTGRKGGSLSSGEDLQMVWQAIKAGLAAGMHPDLMLTHLIPGTRTSLRYLKRLAFGTGVSYHPALVQSFPEVLSHVHDAAPSTPRILSILMRQAIRSAAGGRVRRRLIQIDFANSLGLICGHLTVAGHGHDHWTFRIARRLGLS